MESQVTVAREMAANYLAVGDEVWVPLIETKAATVDVDTPAGALEVLEAYAHAERDYLSIPILQKHLEFLIDRHAYFSALEPKPEELGELFSTEWTREAIATVVTKGHGHLTKSQQIWRLQRDWELEMLQISPAEEKPFLVDYIQSLILERLEQPHAGHEDTFQSYSSFTTTYKSASEYESLLVSASKSRSRAVKAYERREATELALTSLDAYAQYIAFERRQKILDGFVLVGLYERAITEAAKHRFSGEPGAEAVLRTFWIGYLDFLWIQLKEDDTTSVLRRAARSVPGSGEVWARYIRCLERRETLDAEGESMEDAETIADVYNRALSTNLFSKANAAGSDRDPEQIIPLVLARASAERRVIQEGRGGEDAWTTLVTVVEDGLAMVRQASKAGDPRFRLEKFLSESYRSITNVPEAAVQLWAATAKHYKSSWASWVAYTDALVHSDHHDLARSTFKDVSTKNLDYPEALWDAWINFEYAHGSLASLEDTMARIERARTQAEARRMKQAQKAYDQRQYSMGQQAPVAPAASMLLPDVGGAPTAISSGENMDIDAATSDARGKRKADCDGSSEGGDTKKPRLEQPTIPLKRDRENSTVFVADLPPATSEAKLRTLFKDCGEVRDVKITQLPELLVATVEFMARDSVPAALTKDKKRIDGMEVKVHLAWRSTLYVTNFPEKWDDTSVRDLFGQYGLIFDVRWPSKKFKATRRFCYVQYTSPESAERALELHGREFEPERTLNVYVSNPGRRKERTDADANDREVYVAGLSKFTSKEDLQELFSTYGSVKDIRLAQDKSGQLKGFAFVEFQYEGDAHAALSANNYELKKRRIAVTLADTRVRPKNREEISDTGLGRRAETRSRSVRIRNLPPDTQEGLLQQVLERHAVVKRVEVLMAEREAIVELENAAEAGKLMLRAEPIVFQDVNLVISEETTSGPSRAPPPSSSVRGGSMFVPRSTASRPRAGLGRTRKPGIGAMTGASGSTGASYSISDVGNGRSQDDFRKMLG
ncbi:hypothetical protein SCLCIDRAFT_136495 [Scleroderma citrinum Foug A]|uniref:U4/U6 snRNA-associated-splicing factor PRP24 n=1 Tax=Scleroderma citrinum Foug A TaxID=1036808 RepID=A0A0C3DE15_9AGAM|nr:hypothetical protein SCLCIDRAFT_136495 [Scleroderma citrinum Foug A]